MSTSLNDDRVVAVTYVQCINLNQARRPPCNPFTFLNNMNNNHTSTTRITRNIQYHA